MRYLLISTLLVMSIFFENFIFPSKIQKKNQNRDLPLDSNISKIKYLEKYLKDSFMQLPDTLNILFYSVFEDNLKITDTPRNNKLQYSIKDSIFFRKILLPYYLKTKIIALNDEYYISYIIQFYSIIGFNMEENQISILIRESELEPRLRLVKIRIKDFYIDDILVKGYDKMMSDEFYYSKINFISNKITTFKYKIQLLDSDWHRIELEDVYGTAYRKIYEINFINLKKSKLITNDTIKVHSKTINNETVWLE